MKKQSRTLERVIVVITMVKWKSDVPLEMLCTALSLINSCKNTGQSNILQCICFQAPLSITNLPIIKPFVGEHVFFVSPDPFVPGIHCCEIQSVFL